MSINKLQVFGLTTIEDCNLYNNFLAQIDPTNPFFMLELISNVHLGMHSLKYFIFLEDNMPKVLMIINIRPIEIGSEKTPYFDVISPYSYSGPLMTESTQPETIISFWNAVDDWYLKNNIITEFIRFSLNNNHLFYSGKIVPTLNNIKGVIKEEDIQWDSFKSKVRNNYRKAFQHDLDFKISYRNITEDEIREFYNIYTKTMVRKTAERHYFYSLEYFYELIKKNPDHCAIALVTKNGIPISTELLLLSTDTVFSFLGGTNAQFFETRPNDFLKINVLNWARKMGYKYYNLGGGRINQDGLYDYKKSFFPKDKDDIYFTGRKILNLNIYEELVRKAQNIAESSEMNKYDNTNDYFPTYRFPYNISNFKKDLSVK